MSPIVKRYNQTEWVTEKNLFLNQCGVSRVLKNNTKTYIVQAESFKKRVDLSILYTIITEVFGKRTKWGISQESTCFRSLNWFYRPYRIEFSYQNNFIITDQDLEAKRGWEENRINYFSIRLYQISKNMSDG